jgi:hypothetical protein
MAAITTFLPGDIPLWLFFCQIDRGETFWIPQHLGLGIYEIKSWKGHEMVWKLFGLEGGRYLFVLV